MMLCRIMLLVSTNISINAQCFRDLLIMGVSSTMAVVYCVALDGAMRIGAWTPAGCGEWTIADSDTDRHLADRGQTWVGAMRGHLGGRGGSGARRAGGLTPMSRGVENFEQRRVLR
jgi:hypothetical protein